LQGGTKEERGEGEALKVGTAGREKNIFGSREIPLKGEKMGRGQLEGNEEDVRN